MDYDLVLKLEKQRKLKERSDCTVKLQGFTFFSVQKGISQILFQVCLNP